MKHRDVEDIFAAAGGDFGLWIEDHDAGTTTKLGEIVHVRAQGGFVAINPRGTPIGTYATAEAALDALFDAWRQRGKGALQ